MDVENKVKEYENLIHETFRIDLKNVLDERDRIYDLISE
jgi:hypothetical protein